MDHQSLLKQALALAAARRGFCAPNPAVGAVVVKNGEIIGQGCHWACGEPHAEAVALLSLAPEMVKGASLYVTLEPCNHWGRTPPCTELIQQLGIAEVYYAYADPNPIAEGGAQTLIAAGIFCAHCPFPEADLFYRSYTHWLKTGLPWVTAKLAVSFDGKIAGPHGEPVALTGPEVGRFTHLNRLHSDALLTTVKTVIQDDPALNVRLQEASAPLAKPVYVVDRTLSLPAAARLFHTASALTVFYGATAPHAQVESFQHRGVHCIPISQTPDGQLDLVAILRTIGEAGVHDLWVEAGGVFFTALHVARLVQRRLIYVAPQCLGPSAQAAFQVPLDFSRENDNITWSYSGNDAICELITL